VAPLANRVSRWSCPDSYFANIASLFAKLDGIPELLRTPAPRASTGHQSGEMVLRETQRASSTFPAWPDGRRHHRHRVLPEEVTDVLFSGVARVGRPRCCGD